MNNISLNQTLHNKSISTKVLDVQYEFSILNQGVGKLELTGSDVNTLISIITTDMLIVNKTEYPNSDEVLLFKPYVKRLLTRKTRAHSAKDYAKLIDEYINPQTRSQLSSLDSLHTEVLKELYSLIGKLDLSDPTDLLIEELGLTTNVNNALFRTNIKTLKDLEKYMQSQKLIDIPKLGKLGVDSILKALDNLKEENLKKKANLVLPCNHCNANLLKVGFGIEFNADVSNSYIYNETLGKFELDTQEINSDRNSNIFCFKCRKTLSEDVANMLEL